MEKAVGLDFIPSPHVNNIQVCFVNRYGYIHAEILSTWILRAQALQMPVSRPVGVSPTVQSYIISLVPTPGLTSEYLHVVCAYVKIHAHTRTYTLTPRQNRKDTDKHRVTLINLCVKNKPPRQQQVLFMD